VPLASFLGSHRHTLDSKGRLALPSSFRRITGVKQKDGPQPQLILMRGFNRCVWAFLEESWRRIEDRLRDRQFKDQDSRDFLLELTRDVEVVPVDAAGRILIPQSHLTLAGLERGKEVLTLGMLDHIELWDPASYDEHMAKKGGSFEENSRELFTS